MWRKPRLVLHYHCKRYMLWTSDMAHVMIISRELGVTGQEQAAGTSWDGGRDVKSGFSSPSVIKCVSMREGKHGYKVKVRRRVLHLKCKESGRCGACMSGATKDGSF